MRPTAPGFSDALTRSHRVVTRVEVLVAGRPVQAFDATSDAGVVGGQVTVDADAQVRRTLTLELADSTGQIIPTRVGDLLTPPNEVRVSQGVEGYDLVPLFVGGISKPSTSDQGSGVTLTLECSDRSRTISVRSWVQPYVVTRGTNTATAIAALLTDRAPELPALNSSPTTTSTPTVIFGEDDSNDPWADATSLAEAAGLELFFDADGVPTLRPVPDPLADPVVATYAEGPDGLLLSGQRAFSDDPGHNGVIVIGEGSEISEAFRVAAWDTDPSSPTYYDPANPTASRWGPRPKFIRSELILTAGQALLTADAELRKLLGTVEEAAFSGVPNPAHEAGDVIALRRDRIRLGGRYVLQNFRLPLGPGQMDGSCRSRNLG